MENKNFYKVYEVEGEAKVNRKADSQPTYFVGAFIDEAAAKKLCGTMEISKGNSAKVEYGEITYSDIADLKKFGLESADKEALNQMQVMMDAQAKDNENQPEL